MATEFVVLPNLGICIKYESHNAAATVVAVFQHTQYHGFHPWLHSVAPLGQKKGKYRTAYSMNRVWRFVLRGACQTADLADLADLVENDGVGDERFAQRLAGDDDDRVAGFNQTFFQQVMIHLAGEGFDVGRLGHEYGVDGE